MRLIAEITEHEMVATFLQAEIRSERFGPDLAQLVHRDGMSPTVIEQPDLMNADENAYRLRLLGEFRGYGQNRGLFENYPSHVTWQRVALTPEELLQVKYIDYSYWNEISNGTRLPTEAAKTIRSGRPIFEMSTEGFLRIADALRRGATFPELILVRAAVGSDIVILEGHVRLTVYALVPELTPSQVIALLGTSPDFKGW